MRAEARRAVSMYRINRKGDRRKERKRDRDRERERERERESAGGEEKKERSRVTFHARFLGVYDIYESSTAERIDVVAAQKNGALCNREKIHPRHCMYIREICARCFASIRTGKHTRTVPLSLSLSLSLSLPSLAAREQNLIKPQLLGRARAADYE